MFCCRSHGDGDIGLGICNHPPLLWIVNNIVTFKLCSQKFNPNQKILLKIRTADFLMILAKLYKKISQMQNLGQLGPENCRAYVFFACFLFVCFVLFLFFVFPLFFLFIFPPPPLFSYSSPDLNLHLYSIFHIARFQFQKYKNTKFSASERAHPPQTPPVCASMQLALTLHQIIPQCRRRKYSPL